MADIWNNLVCTHCKNYLNSYPVTVVSKRGPKCGRCHTQQGYTGTLSLFNTVAPYVVFPCPNRYEGCNMLFQLEDVADHLETCRPSLDHYQCPVEDCCSAPQPSILALEQHYKRFHKKILLEKPEFEVPERQTEDEIKYLYCNDSLKFFAVLYVRRCLDGLSVNASTMGLHLNTAKFRVDLRQCDNKAVVWMSEYKKFSLYNTNFDVVTVDLSVLGEEKLQCNIMFKGLQNCTVAFTSIKEQGGANCHWKVQKLLEQFGTLKGPVAVDVEVCESMPEPYLNKDLSAKCEVRKEKGQVCVFKQETSEFLAFKCEYCENLNFSASPNAMAYCKNCTNIICNKCIKQCVENLLLHCPFCQATSDCIESLYDPERCKLLYYCRKGCLKFFNGNELELHEEHCQSSPPNHVTIAKKLFGSYFHDNNNAIIYMSNHFVMDPDILGDKGHIYMIAKQNFHCILFYEKESNIYRFSVAHKYLPAKFYVLVRVVQSGHASESTNSFSVSAEEKAFVVVLLKVSYKYRKDQQPLNKAKKYIREFLRRNLQM